MLRFITNLVTIIYEYVGDFGLVFLLFIVVINLYLLWCLYPKQIQRRMKGVDTAIPNPWDSWQKILRISRIFYSIIFGVFVGGVALTSGPALWLKIISIVVFFALSMSLIRSFENSVSAK